jgi:hypothetical protein
MRLSLSIARGQSGNAKNKIIKKLIYGERFHYICSRGRDPNSDISRVIKLRGVNLTHGIYWTLSI